MGPGAVVGTVGHEVIHKGGPGWALRQCQAGGAWLRLGPGPGRPDWAELGDLGWGQSFGREKRRADGQREPDAAGPAPGRTRRPGLCRGHHRCRPRPCGRTRGSPTVAGACAPPHPQTEKRFAAARTEHRDGLSRADVRGLGQECQLGSLFPSSPQGQWGWQRTWIPTASPRNLNRRRGRCEVTFASWSHSWIFFIQNAVSPRGAASLVTSRNMG